jgi:hypothetical protein
VKKLHTLLLLLAFALVADPPSHSSAAAVATVTVTGVAAYNSSVKIYFKPVSGANDYRVYDITGPNDVKYAGLTNEDSRTPVPATQIDYNAVGDGKPHTLVVEAVDRLGPVPHVNLYNPDRNLPLVNPLPADAMLGGNRAQSDDGKTSTNGQGPYTNNPQPIAVSQPFVVQANSNYRAIPSKPGALSTFFDTFDNAEGSTIQQISNTPIAPRLAPLATYTMNAGTALAETIQYQLADTMNSMPFISADHFMDVLFDGGNPGTSLPLHQGHAVMAFSPDATAAWSSGQILHVTEEVDGHTDGRRWMDILIVPANDPARAFDADTDAFNQTNQAVRLQIFNQGFCTLDIYTGPPGGGTQIPTGTAGGSHGSRIWGAYGQAPVACNAPAAPGFDNKSRFDLFLTQKHAAYLIDGRLILQSDIPDGTFPWAYQSVKIYYSHYVYHTDNDIIELLTNKCGPMNSFWFNNPLTGRTADQNSCQIAYPSGYGFPRSDERHWDDMGFEVLPASQVSAGSFAGLVSLVQLPAIRPVHAR